MNFRSNSTHALAALLITAAFGGCISEHRYDDEVEWGEWDEESNTCVCENPENNNNGGNNNGGNNNGGNESCPLAADAIYLSKDTAVCATIEFSCPESYDAFNDSCGCGCTETPEVPTCPEENDPSASYLSRDAKVCTIINLTCPEGRDAFLSGCGCGCIDSATTTPPPPPPPPACPDANDPNVLYINTDPAVCASIGFECPENCDRFDSACGCGCIEN